MDAHLPRGAKAIIDDVSGWSSQTGGGPCASITDLLCANDLIRYLLRLPGEPSPVSGEPGHPGQRARPDADCSRPEPRAPSAAAKHSSSTLGRRVTIDRFVQTPIISRCVSLGPQMAFGGPKRFPGGPEQGSVIHEHGDSWNPSRSSIRYPRQEPGTKAGAFWAAGDINDHVSHLRNKYRPPRTSGPDETRLRAVDTQEDAQWTMKAHR